MQAVAESWQPLRATAVPAEARLEQGRPCPAGEGTTPGGEEESWCGDKESRGPEGQDGAPVREMRHATLGPDHGMVNDQ
ncbi:hypothetical protein NDU88_001651 [Pleurodeles waltl]|uniref:Uncharacterized protein n=1 Tax=Pleurodeles waltl TaxID=8319 RepID=A0AAV7UA42_PLEWA|nr:hypothetical protein NDU88_001651 [Pleurodeles waltl]